MSFRGDLEALILGVLQNDALHGYEIAKRIKAAGSDLLSVGEGQLYPVLHAMEKDALVTASWIPQEGKPSRKVYALTDAGRGALAKKTKEWEGFARGVSLLLKGGVRA
jgi:PadR family transcriptional regulator PadR